MRSFIKFSFLLIFICLVAFVAYWIPIQVSLSIFIILALIVSSILLCLRVGFFHHSQGQKKTQTKNSRTTSLFVKFTFLLNFIFIVALTLYIIPREISIGIIIVFSFFFLGALSIYSFIKFDYVGVRFLSRHPHLKKIFFILASFIIFGAVICYLFGISFVNYYYDYTYFIVVSLLIKFFIFSIWKLRQKKLFFDAWDLVVTFPLFYLFLSFFIMMTVNLGSFYVSQDDEVKDAFFSEVWVDKEEKVVCREYLIVNHFAYLVRQYPKENPFLEKLIMRDFTINFSNPDKLMEMLEGKSFKCTQLASLYNNKSRSENPK